MVKLCIKMAGWGGGHSEDDTNSIVEVLLGYNFERKKSRFVSGSKKKTRRSIHTTAQRIY